MSIKIELSSTEVAIRADLDLSEEMISGLGAAVDTGDLVRVQDAKTLLLPVASPSLVVPFVKLSGSTMVGSLNMGKNITGLSMSDITSYAASVEKVLNIFQYAVDLNEDANKNIFPTIAQDLKKSGDAVGLNPGTTNQIFPLAGGSLSGALVMNDSIILGLPSATIGTSPVIQSNLTGKCLCSGGSLTGDLTMSSNEISNISSVGIIDAKTEKQNIVSVKDVVDNFSSAGFAAPYMAYMPSSTNLNYVVTKGTLYDWKSTGGAVVNSTNSADYFIMQSSVVGGSLDRINFLKEGVYIFTMLLVYDPGTVISSSESVLRISLGPDSLNINSFILSSGRTVNFSAVIPLMGSAFVFGPYITCRLNNAGTIRKSSWQISAIGAS